MTPLPRVFIRGKLQKSVQNLHTKWLLWKFEIIADKRLDLKCNALTFQQCILQFSEVQTYNIARLSVYSDGTKAHVGLKTMTEK